MDDLKKYIRNIPDFPEKGIIFRDITTLFADPSGLREVVDNMYDICKEKNIDKIAVMEARGFLIGAPLAYKLSKGVVLIRKKGKLPFNTISRSYELEYGSAEMEIHIDAVSKDDNVLLIDDLIATGGTAEAGVKLIRELGADVTSSCFIINLPDLGGVDRLAKLGVETNYLCSFSGS